MGALFHVLGLQGSSLRIDIGHGRWLGLGKRFMEAGALVTTSEL
jgi:hypothetical protein